MGGYIRTGNAEGCVLSWHFFSSIFLLFFFFSLSLYLSRISDAPSARIETPWARRQVDVRLSSRRSAHADTTLASIPGINVPARCSGLSMNIAFSSTASLQQANQARRCLGPGSARHWPEAKLEFHRRGKKPLQFRDKASLIETLPTLCGRKISVMPPRADLYPAAGGGVPLCVSLASETTLGPFTEPSLVFVLSSRRTICGMFGGKRRIAMLLVIPLQEQRSTRKRLSYSSTGPRTRWTRIRTLLLGGLSRNLD